jgi:hypothetical protein
MSAASARLRDERLEVAIRAVGVPTNGGEDLCVPDLAFLADDRVRLVVDGDAAGAGAADPEFVELDDHLRAGLADSRDGRTSDEAASGEFGEGFDLAGTANIRLGH